MLELCKEFNRFNKQGKILNLDFLRRYITYLTGIYDATDYVQKVQSKELSANTYASYFPELHRIVVSYNNIISGIEIVEETQFKDFTIEQVEKLNIELIFSISHECYHAVQMMLIETYRDKRIASALFSDCLDISINNYKLYKKSYTYIPIEVNANILGKLAGVRFINRLLSVQTAANNNSIIMNDILSIITNSNNKMFSPTKRFYKVINNQNRYEEIMKKDALTDFQRLVLGLPITEEYFSKLASISDKTVETAKLKQYLKK